MVTHLTNLNLNNLKFEEPVCNVLQSLNRHYYTQALKLNDGDLIIPTEWFFANGLKNTIDNKRELKVTITPEFRTNLRSIEEMAIRGGLKLPSDFQTPHTNAEIFKCLPDHNSLYIKFNYDAACFDRSGQLLKFESLSMGDYRAMIHVKGLYIGYHPSQKLVSLQLRIVQLQYVPRMPQCLFAAVPMPVASPVTPSFTSLPISTSRNGMPETPQPGVAAAPLNQLAQLAQSVQSAQPSKRGRKPTKLQRQNAVVIDGKIQAEEHRKVDAIPPDFFHDALMDLTNIAASTMSN